MTSQLVIFRAFFFLFFFVPPTLDLKKNSRKSTNKKNLALFLAEIDVRLSVCPICVRYTSTVQHVSGIDIWKAPFYLDG